jgi:hypothetical protein
VVICTQEKSELEPLNFGVMFSSAAPTQLATKIKSRYPAGKEEKTISLSVEASVTVAKGT